MKCVVCSRRAKKCTKYKNWETVQMCGFCYAVTYPELLHPGYVSMCISILIKECDERDRQKLVIPPIEVAI